MAVPQAASGAVSRHRAWSRAAFDRWERLATGRPALAVMFVWAVAEATVWPIIPDLLLAPLILGAGRRGWRLLIASATGSALGGACLYLLAWWHPEQMLAFVTGLPLVSGEQVMAADRWLREQGVLAFLRQPWSGVPFKAWAVAGAARELGPLPAIPVFIAARTLRMALVAGVVALIRERCAGHLRAWFLPVAIAYLLAGAAGWWMVMR